MLKISLLIQVDRNIFYVKCVQSILRLAMKSFFIIFLYSSEPKRVYGPGLRANLIGLYGKLLYSSEPRGFFIKKEKTKKQKVPRVSEPGLCSSPQGLCCGPQPKLNVFSQKGKSVTRKNTELLYISPILHGFTRLQCGFSY